jgi:uncharacterized protein (DUF58 family)
MPASPAPEAIPRRLEWPVARRLEGLLQGGYRTVARGPGTDLADIREYQYHDDVRHIDWNVTARMQTPHVREFLEDREITAWFLLDLSASLDFGSGSVSKRAVLAEFTTLVCRLLAGRGNRVGAMLFHDHIERVIPARGGRRQVLHILDAVQRRDTRPRSPRPTDLGLALREAGRIVKRRSALFLVSDFISMPGWEQPLEGLAARHDVVAVRLLDPLETRLPDLGLLTFQDAETGEQLFVDTHDKGFRRRFAAIAEAREDALRATFAHAGVDAMELSTGDDTVDALARFAQMRRRRMTAPAAGMAS